MNIPFSDMMKSIPGTVGVRLEEELPYERIRVIGDIEIRHYPPFTLARTKSLGEFEATQEENFRTLAEFIYGSNDENRKVSMTTPVFHDREADGWLMSFYLPPTAEKLKPRDASIYIERMPGKVVAVYRYSGNADLERMEEARQKLLSQVFDAGLIATSEVWWAQYDQPFALPFIKRNEALVKVES